MLDSYYRLRGWDRDGVPLNSTLSSWGLHKEMPAKHHAGEDASLPLNELSSPLLWGENIILDGRAVVFTNIKI
jgi:hypothetical protein